MRASGSPCPRACGWCSSRHSPELQPAERLWPLAREALANQSFASLADLDRALAARCLALADQPDLIEAHTRFHWWPDAA